MRRPSLLTMVLCMIIYATSTGLAVEKFTVDGIDVIVKTNPANEIIATYFCLKGGIAFYKTERAGIEAVLFRSALEGTENYPKDKLRSELARMGTAIGSEAGHDYTSLTMQCLKRHLDESWAIFADIIARPLCDEADVDLVRERQQNDVHQTHADPDGYARLLSDALYFRDHPYAVSPSGTEETIAALSAASLLSYHASNVTRTRALVVFVGNVDRATATRMVREGLGSLPEGSFRMPELPTPGGKTAVDHKLAVRELPTNYVRGYFPTPSPENIVDAVPMFVGLDILRDRLFEEVRTKRNLTYAVSSAMASRRNNYGLLYVTSVDATQAVSVMLDEVAKMQHEPVPEKDLHDKIKVLTTETLMGEQTNGNQAATLALQEILGQGFEMAEKRMELIQQVTAAEIQRVMKEYANGFNFTVLGDTTEGQKMLEAVAAR
ncbi:M16 family metallopeptidase [Candidatus Zixiibacteriota bacterium]